MIGVYFKSLGKRWWFFLGWELWRTGKLAHLKVKLMDLLLVWM